MDALIETEALNAAIEFHDGDPTVSADDVVETATTFARFLQGQWFRPGLDDATAERLAMDPIEQAARQGKVTPIPPSG